MQPARERSRRLANRPVYGERASPYEVLSEFSRGMAAVHLVDAFRIRWADSSPQPVGGTTHAE